MAAAPDPTLLHPVAGQDRVVFLKPLVTEHARAIMAGEPAELERIVAEHGLA